MSGRYAHLLGGAKPVEPCQRGVQACGGLPEPKPEPMRRCAALRSLVLCSNTSLLHEKRNVVACAPQSPPSRLPAAPCRQGARSWPPLTLSKPVECQACERPGRGALNSGESYDKQRWKSFNSVYRTTADATDPDRNPVSLMVNAGAFKAMSNANDSANSEQQEGQSTSKSAKTLSNA